MNEVHWRPRSRSEQGMQSEKNLAKKRGARLHPRSGAGRIKDDMSTDDELIEAKEVAKTHSLKGADLNALFKRAVRQGKEPVYTIYFVDADLTVDLTLRRGRH